jgi:hypothetical protein
MQIPPKEYARGVLAERYTAERLKKRGEVLGKRIDEALHRLGSYYQLEAILREGTNFRWVARILTPKGVKNVQIPLDLADDVIDSKQASVPEELKGLVLKGVDRGDLLGSSE